jgi:hypothetical protein
VIAPVPSPEAKLSVAMKIVRQSGNPEHRHEHQHAEDQPAVVEKGRQARKQEVFLGLQAGHHQPADGKNQQRDQVEPHE